MNDRLLEVRDAVVEFSAHGGTIRALDGVSLEVRAGETLAVVGESGSGKTTLARAVLGLQSLKSGEIRLQGQSVRGVGKGIAERVGMVWQDPFASLDPRWPLRKSMLEPAVISGRSVDLTELLEEVRLDPVVAERYPHQVSGGQRQRAAIARALALRPPLVICDEPTAALDLSIRAQILNLLKAIQAELGTAFLYISHDLMTVRFLADRIAVMYLGRIVEEGPAEEVFDRPRHPYTRALLDSAPDLDQLGHIPDPPPGEIPDPRTRFVGCRYASRCPNAQADCAKNDPGETRYSEHRYFCHHPIETGEPKRSPEPSL